MKNIKYIYRRIGFHSFRIKLRRYEDDFHGVTCVHYTIQEPADLPRNLFMRIKQFFTVRDFYDGNWNPLLADKGIEDTIIATIGALLEEWDKNENAKTEWASL